MEGGSGLVEIKRHRRWGKAADFLLDILFPIECLGCGGEGIWLCDTCRARIPAMSENRCPACKKFSAAGEIHVFCRRHSSLDGVLAAADYESFLVRKLITTLKYNSVRELAEPIGLLMAHKAREHPFFIEENWLLVPVPLHRRRFLERGFNQAELFCQVIARNAALSPVGALSRVSERPPQATLHEADRLVNIKNIFRAEEDIVRSKKIILVDDVYTTGATMRECARVLKSAGAREVWGLVAAMPQ